MTSASGRSFQSERGAIVIQTAIGLLVLFGFASYVVDYGIYWVARGQAQNAADAAAIAGATALAYDEPDDPLSSFEFTVLSSQAIAESNLVWTKAPKAEVSFVCPPGVSGGSCVQVTAHRDGLVGSERLPSFLGPVLGLPATQNVKASATAKVQAANTTDCLRPFAIPDKWIEKLLPVNRYQAYQEGQPIGTPLPNPVDSYTAPTDAGAGTGWVKTDDTFVSMQFDPLGFVMLGSMQPLELPGGRTYPENIASCNGQLVSIGQQIPISFAADATALTTGTGLNDLVALDPLATWDPATKHVEGGCAPTCAAISPRLIVVAIYHDDEYEKMRAAADWTGCGGVPCVRIVNLVGLFINLPGAPVTGSTDGYLTVHPGMMLGGSPTVTADSSFLKSVTLVR